MDYIKEIRALVGHRPIILVAAPVLAFDDEGRILLQLRSDTKNWGIPGGYMELGESPEETARRELQEETGLQAESFELISVLSGPGYELQYPNGDVVHAVNIVYRVAGVHGELRKDHESLALEYFPLDALPDDILPTNRLILERTVLRSRA